MGRIVEMGDDGSGNEFFGGGGMYGDGILEL